MLGFAYVGFVCYCVVDCVVALVVWLVLLGGVGGVGVVLEVCWNLVWFE